MHPEVQREHDDFWMKLEEGQTFNCPCCRRYAQMYKRPIGPGQAIPLLAVFKKVGMDPYREPEVLPRKSEGQLTLTKHWGLVMPWECPSGVKDPKRQSRWWRITDRGKDWLEGEIRIAKYAYLFDDTHWKLEGPRITWLQAVRAPRFDLDKLMESFDMTERMFLYDEED